MLFRSRNYDESYMVDADLSKMQRLVHAAQDNMKIRLSATPPKNVFDAESTILRYANLCSFLGMQNLLNDSVSAKADQIQSESDVLTRNEVVKVVVSAVPPISMTPAVGTAKPSSPSTTAPPPPPPGAVIPSNLP